MEQSNSTARLIKRIALGLFIIWIASFVVIQGLIFSAASTQEDVKVDYVVVLGAGLRGEEPSVALATRLAKSLAYLEKYPEVIVIVSGGQGPGETITEAEAMQRFLVQNGIAADRIIKEEQSTNTWENIIFTGEILSQMDNGEVREIAILTSEFHLFRAKYLARQYGFTPYGIPADTPTLVLARYLVREYFAVIKSLILDV